ncbi:hypothetical protein KCU93_g4938, partial [Aureobasidium melanogenum]
MAPKPSRFAAEILTLIAMLADVEDLTNFHLVCRPFHDAAAKWFGEAFFTDRAHVLSHSSMAELLLMSSNSKVGPYIRQLGFNSILLPLPSFIRAHETGLDGRALVSRAAARHEQFVCLESSIFEQQLMLVLHNLKVWGSHPIKVHVYCNQGPYHGWGWQSLLPKHDPTPLEVFRASPPSIERGAMHEITAAFTHAVLLTNYPMSGMVLDFNHRCAGPTSILHYLNELPEETYHSARISGGDLLCRRFAAGFNGHSRGRHDTLHYVPETKHLEIRSGVTSGIINDFQAFTSWLPQNSISTLILRDITTYWEGKIDTFLTHNPQLKHFELHSCQFWGLEWSEMFTKLIADDNNDEPLPQLEYCCFTDLRLQEPEIYARITELVSACNERHEYRGHEEIQQGLELLSARFKTLEETDFSSDSDDTDVTEDVLI